ncbi:MAG TPA: phosphoenolpyruvate carboxykinase [Aliidongia sp.]|nr:phosphoenolpyruvate carboxykinase [Aliidongia sp.]
MQHKDGSEANLGHGLVNLAAIHRNLSVPSLYEHAIRNGEGRIVAGGAFVAVTGQHTGRSPKDKYIVREASTESGVNWGEVNQPVSEAVFDQVHQRMLAYFQRRPAYVVEVYAGADPAYRLPVRIVTEQAWHSLFARNMFIRPPAADLQGFGPEFTILQAPGLVAMPEFDQLRSQTFILVNMAKRLVLIGGTSYAGEIKKSIFGVLNYLLPAKGVLPMHCSANVGADGRSAIFFGLSGTGKTTLSADSTRTLIGDDEHGWSDRGIFNFEGGCYAKVIKLSEEAEPEIWEASGRFGTVLENVVFDPASHVPDYDDGSLTENTRSCYPLDFIANASATGMADHPDTVIFLTADAFGVLPPISRLSADQAMYHFLSGYTARVAGTEKGLGKEPQATFSTCFGAPFMPRHPTVYAKLLGERITKHQAKCWLVNTGWSGGAYGTGERIRIAYTRAMVRAALDGRLAEVAMRPDGHFGLSIPEQCPDVPAEVLNARKTWKDAKAYDAAAQGLTKRFENNFKQFEGLVDPTVKAAGIHAAA